MVTLKRLPIKCPVRIRSQGRSFLAVVTVQAGHTLICQSPIVAPNVSRGVHGNRLLVITDFYTTTTVQQLAPATISVGAGVLQSPGSAWAAPRTGWTRPRSPVLWLTFPCARAPTRQGILPPGRLTWANNRRWAGSKGQAGCCLFGSLDSHLIGSEK
jgi:hypothetical protein